MRYFRLSEPISEKLKVTTSKWLWVAAIVCFSGCSSYYKHLVPGKGDVHCIEQFTPQYVSTMYSAYVDVTKHHFSGILFIKQMPDSSTRIVFANEIGVKFFDFSFSKEGEFTKNYILEKMDKKAESKDKKDDKALAKKIKKKK